VIKVHSLCFSYVYRSYDIFRDKWNWPRNRREKLCRSGRAVSGGRTCRQYCKLLDLHKHLCVRFLCSLLSHFYPFFFAQLRFYKTALRTIVHLRRTIAMFKTNVHLREKKGRKRKSVQRRDVKNRRTQKSLTNVPSSRFVLRACRSFI